MTIHELKTHREHFDAVADGTKTAELRLDDRHYAVKDVLRLRRYDPVTQTFDSVPPLDCFVTHVLRGGPWLAEGYAMLSFWRVTGVTE